MISRLAPIRRYRPIDLRNPINWNAPLNRGLVYCGYGAPGLSGGSNLYDLLGITSAPLVGPSKWATSPYGAAIDTSGGGGEGGVAIQPIASSVKIPFPSTIASWINVTGMPSVYSLIFGTTNNNTSAAPYAGLTFQWRPDMSLLFNGGGGSQAIGVGSAYTAYQGKWTRILGTWNSYGQINYYENGLPVFSSATTYTSPTYGATAGLIIGNEPGTSLRICNTIVACPEIWNVNFTAAMALADYNEQLLGMPTQLNRVSSMLPLLRSGGANSYTETNTDSLTLSDSDFSIRRTFPLLDQNAVSHNRHRRNWQLLTKYYNSLG